MIRFGSAAKAACGGKRSARQQIIIAATLAFAQLRDAASIKAAAAFLRAAIAAVPFKIHIVLSDNGVLFCDRPSRRSGPSARWRLYISTADVASTPSNIASPSPATPWTNGQVGRMNRTLKEVTVRRVITKPIGISEITSLPSW